MSDVLFCKPTEKNYKNGTISIQASEVKKLRNGEYKAVAVVDRVSGKVTTFDANYVLKHSFEHTYSVTTKWGKRFLKKLVLFQFSSKTVSI